MATRQTISLSDLRDMSPKEKEEALGDLVEGARAPANGRLTDIDARIAEFERIYELPSDEMVAEVDSGARKETDEIASWLMLLRVRKRVAAHPAG